MVRCAGLAQQQGLVGCGGPDVREERPEEPPQAIQDRWWGFTAP